MLLVFDGWENISQIESGESSPGDYEKYNNLLRRIAERRHQSCVIITSQDEPKELSSLRNNKSVNFTKLYGLEFATSLKILQAKNLNFRPEQAEKLINDYHGNPSILNHVCEHIKNVFDGNVTQYETYYTTLFPLSFETAIKENCRRLSDLEVRILKIIAGVSTPIEYEKLKSQIENDFSISNSDLQINLLSLLRRSLIESNSQGSVTLYNIQPAIKKCVRKFYRLANS